MNKTQIRNLQKKLEEANKKLYNARYLLNEASNVYRDVEQALREARDRA